MLAPLIEESGPAFIGMNSEVNPMNPWEGIGGQRRFGGNDGEHQNPEIWSERGPMRQDVRFFGDGRRITFTPKDEPSTKDWIDGFAEGFTVLAVVNLFLGFHAGPTDVATIFDMGPRAWNNNQNGDRGNDADMNNIYLAHKRNSNELELGIRIQGSDGLEWCTVRLALDVDDSHESGWILVSASYTGVPGQTAQLTVDSHRYRRGGKAYESSSQCAGPPLSGNRFEKFVLGTDASGSSHSHMKGMIAGFLFTDRHLGQEVSNIFLDDMLQDKGLFNSYFYSSGCVDPRDLAVGAPITRFVRAVTIPFPR